MEQNFFRKYMDILEENAQVAQQQLNRMMANAEQVAKEAGMKIVNFELVPNDSSQTANVRTSINQQAETMLRNTLAKAKAIATQYGIQPSADPAQTMTTSQVTNKDFESIEEATPMGAPTATQGSTPPSNNTSAPGADPAAMQAQMAQNKAEQVRMISDQIAAAQEELKGMEQSIVTKRAQITDLQKRLSDANRQQ